MSPRRLDLLYKKALEFHYLSLWLLVQFVSSQEVYVGLFMLQIVTNSGRASTLAATDAATPTLRRIERAAIAAATPITYHSRCLFFLSWCF